MLLCGNLLVFTINTTKITRNTNKHAIQVSLSQTLMKRAEASPAQLYSQAFQVKIWRFRFKLCSVQFPAFYEKFL